MITIRTAGAADQEALGRFGGALARQHHAADPRRFFSIENPEAGYGRFLVGQTGQPQSTVFVAENSGEPVGYVWTTIEGRDWAQLRGPAGVIQDIYVDASARRLGAGRALLAAALAWIRAHGRTQVVLMTKTKNESAQRLFASVGFRPTMIEMTLELNSEESGDA
jgi:ribosomal protein S18 acetylase RimI-like enzyme